MKFRKIICLKLLFLQPLWFLLRCAEVKLLKMAKWLVSFYSADSVITESEHFNEFWTVLEATRHLNLFKCCWILTWIMLKWLSRSSDSCNDVLNDCTYCRIEWHLPSPKFKTWPFLAFLWWSKCVNSVTLEAVYFSKNYLCAALNLQ